MNKDKLIYVPIQKINEELLEQIRIWRNSPEISKFMYNDHYISKEEHNNWYKNLKSKQDAKFWIIYYHDTPIGIVNLSDIDYINKITNWGFYIGDKNYRGKGISKFILYHLMILVFEKMKFHKMYTTVLENNPIALNLYQKMGFKQEGLLKKHLLRGENYIDVYIMSIIDESWDNLKKDFMNNPEFYEAELNEY